jgi:endonuclease-8
LKIRKKVAQISSCDKPAHTFCLLEESIIYILCMEGPSIVILREEAKSFIGKKIIRVEGNTKVEKERFVNQKVTNLKSWGKHFIICFNDFFVRIHFLMYGSYRINERKENPRLSLVFKKGEFNFYNCSIKIVDGNFYDEYNEEVDVMSDEWNEKKAIHTLKKSGKKTQLCDCLLDQEIFAGVGNIIKNEVLYRIRIHPESLLQALPPKKLKELVQQAREYSFDFYRWKKKFELKKHWLAYKKKTCLRCNIPFIRTYCGNPERLTFYCSNCQKLYGKKIQRIKI